jgi:hypothetical protein
MQNPANFTEYSYPDIVSLRMKNITAKSLGIEFGYSYRMKVVFDNNILTKTLQKNNLFHHSRLEHWHANNKNLDKFIYLNKNGSKRLCSASQYEVNGSGLIYAIPYKIWKENGKNNDYYRQTIYEV